MAEESGVVHHEADHTPERVRPTAEVAPSAPGAAEGVSAPAAGALLTGVQRSGRGNGPVFQAQALHVQRTAGNRALQRLLQGTAGAVPVQRDPGPPAAAAPPAAPAAAPAAPRPFDAGMIDVVGGQPQLVGTVTVAPVDKNIVRVLGPAANMSPVKAGLKAGLKLGPGEVIKIGPVQTLMGSERVGVYREDGAGAGAAPIEEHFTLGQSRDGARGHYSPGEPVFQRAEAPWFLPPGILSDDHPDETLSFSENKTADLYDQPSWQLPLTSGKAKLSATRGQDSFITSIAAQRDGKLIHFNPSKWAIPWTVKTIDAAHTGVGGAGTGESTSAVPPTVDGKIAAFQPGQSWTSYPTVADALGADTHTLMENLQGAKAHDPASYTNTVEALRQKNPTFTVKLTVLTTHGNLGRDHLFLTVAGSQSLARQEFKLNNGGSAAVTFRLTDVLDPALLVGGAGIHFNLELDTVTGVNITGGPTWAYPLAALKQDFPLGDGKYAISGSYA